MIAKTSQNLITIPEKSIIKRGGMVVLSLQEYNKLCARAIPAFYLKGKDAQNLDSEVEKGLKEYKKGKCKVIKSLNDLD